MKVNRRTQAERTATTRAALIAAGRTLFGERGYAAVGIEEVVRRAGVTRGALYHQFGDKRGLFAAVLDVVEEEVLAGVIQRVDAQAGPAQALGMAITAFLDACERADVQRITLLDAPGVLGWEAWREVAERYALGATTALLQAAIDAGVVRDQPVRALAHVMIGALDEAAMYVARAEDRATARAEMEAVLGGLISGLHPS